jgi:biopolymer transport protein ExbB
MNLGSFIEGLVDYFSKVGFIMPPLVVATCVLWYAIGYRTLTLRRGSPRSVRVLVERYAAGSTRKPLGIVDGAVVVGVSLVRRGSHDLRRLLDDHFGKYEREIKAGRTLITSIVAVAPLAGLLGTVTGMIETFDSLADMALFSQSGGIAGGISQALFTTQMGLAVAVPGVVIGKLLDRRQARIEDELVKLKNLLCSGQIEATPPVSKAA